MKLVLTRAAGRDLDDIYDYTFAAWEPIRPMPMSDRSTKRFSRIGDFPEIGSPAGAREGYRQLAHREHLIFYRLVGGEAEVVRVLHRRMDVSRHLR